MIITLRTPSSVLSQSMAAGAASLSDSSIRSPAVVVLLVLDGREVGVLDPRFVGRRGVAARLDRALDAGDEVAQDLLGDEQAALQLGDRLGRRLEEDDVVRALAVAIDRVGQAAAAPGRDLDDLAAGGDDLAGGAVDDRLGASSGDVRAEDEHEFVAAHAPALLLPMGLPR